METGSHDYGRPRTDQERAYAERAAHLAAEMDADRIDMEKAPDGALIPAQLAGRADGWVGDRSHVEGQSERLRALYGRMQEHTDAIGEAIRTGRHPDSLISRAVAMRNLWNKIVEELEK